VNYEKFSDSELVHHSRKGDTNAFGELVRRYMDRAFRIAYGYVRNAEDARDLSQDAFIKAFEALDQFDESRPFAPWFFRILINHCYNHQKRARLLSFVSIFTGRTPPWAGAGPLGGEPGRAGSQGARDERSPASELSERLVNSEEDENREDIREMVWRALKRLSAKHREVVILHEMEGFSVAEIARMLNCSPGTVKSRLFHARKKLRTFLRSFIEQKALDFIG